MERDAVHIPGISGREVLTPAPNDHMELGQQSDFLGVMPSSEMLMHLEVYRQRPDVSAENAAARWARLTATPVAAPLPDPQTGQLVQAPAAPACRM